MPPARKTLVLGLGNSLLGDDAAGPLAIEALAAMADPDVAADFVDGGTLGLALLPAIEAAGDFIAIDAAQFAGQPGEVRIFEGVAMDTQLGGRKTSAHEVALFDLMATASLAGHLPARRALVAVQPACTALGLTLTPAVRAAIPQLCAAVQALLARWNVRAEETLHV